MSLSERYPRDQYKIIEITDKKEAEELLSKRPPWSITEDFGYIQLDCQNTLKSHDKLVVIVCKVELVRELL